jgi:hypothetical protein
MRLTTMALNRYELQTIAKRVHSARETLPLNGEAAAERVVVRRADAIGTNAWKQVDSRLPHQPY